jgi:hypothetical protein
VSTWQAVTAAHQNVQQASQLWTPTFTTSGATVYYGPPAPVQPAVEEKPRKLSPLEWLDEQIGEVLALALP